MIVPKSLVHGTAPARLGAMLAKAKRISMNDILRLLENGNVAQAEQSIRERLAHSPLDAQSWYMLAVVTLRTGKEIDAHANIRRALALAPQDAVLHSNCGKLLLDAGRPEQALPMFDKAAALDKRRATIRLNYAVALHHLGRFAEAAARYREAIGLDPSCGQAYLGLVNCQPYRDAEESPLQALSKSLAKCSDADAKACMHYALAKLHDDLGNVDDAFAQASEANRLERARLPFDRHAYQAIIDQRCDVQTPTWFEQHRQFGHRSDMPILVVGMPRSGTSLVEQMLSNHPHIGGAGELTAWEAANAALRANGGRLNADLAGLVAPHYLGILSRMAPQKSKVIDKMPDNFNYAGLFHTVFPKGKIIHCRRHPLDTCLSIYFHKFTGDFPYAHDLSDLAFYYRQYLRLTAHWRSALPTDCWLDVDYEALVADPQRQARRMMAFLGMPFDAAVLRPQDNPRPVRTSSAWQVRQPVYRTAQGKWQRYAAHLTALMPLAPR